MKTEIYILKVANGYIVRPQSDWRDGISRADEIHVFETFAGLTSWLLTHFEIEPSA